MNGSMIGFQYRQNELACEGVPLSAVARAAGTPVHVYSAGVIAQRYAALDRAFAGHPHRVHYALKANSTLAVVRLFQRAGAGADVNSGGELEVALRAGFSPGDIVFTGVGKTNDELDRAVSLDLAAINVESSGEAARIEARARTTGRTVRIGVRVNPDVEAGTHRHIATGHAAAKFGMPVAMARAALPELAQQAHLQVVGLHAHIGSQVTDARPFVEAANVLAELAAAVMAKGVPLEHIDIGGGLGVAYEPGQSVLTADDYAAALDPLTRLGLKLLLEPGRWIVGPAGVLITTVVDVKPKPDGGLFVVADEGMTELLRPALYGAWHAIEAVAPRKGAPALCDVAGPICETSDTLGAARTLPPLEPGDLLAIRDTGAYGAVMASNYNRRPLAAEVLVEGERWTVVRRRQTIDEMLQWDALC